MLGISVTLTFSRQIDEIVTDRFLKNPWWLVSSRSTGEEQVCLKFIITLTLQRATSNRPTNYFWLQPDGNKEVSSQWSCQDRSQIAFRYDPRADFLTFTTIFFLSISHQSVIGHLAWSPLLRTLDINIEFDWDRSVALLSVSCCSTFKLICWTWTELNWTELEASGSNLIKCRAPYSELL